MFWAKIARQAHKGKAMKAIVLVCLIADSPQYANATRRVELHCAHEEACGFGDIGLLGIERAGSGGEGGAGVADGA